MLALWLLGAGLLLVIVAVLAVVSANVVASRDDQNLGRTKTFRMLFSEMRTEEHEAHPMSLSPREIEILRLKAAGYTDGQVCRLLHCSYYTVRTHIDSTLTKLCVFNVASAIVIAHQKSILDVAVIEVIPFPTIPNFGE